MKEDAVGAAAGFEALDDHARLRIDDDDLVVIQIGGVDQAAVRRDGNIANEVAIGRLGGDGERPGGSQRAVGECEFEYRRPRSAAHVDAVALRRECEAQPAVSHGGTAEFARRRRIDDADRRRIVPAVQNQQKFAVR